MIYTLFYTFVNDTSKLKKNIVKQTMEYYSVIKNNEILPFMAWIDLNVIMLGEISQRETNTI